MGLKRNQGVAAALAALLMSALASAAQAQAQAHDLTLPQRSADPVTLHLTDETPHAEMLTVYVRGAETPIAGRYSPAGNTLAFAPAFGFEPGQDYVAHILTNGEEAQIAFRIPDATAPGPAAVTEIFPSGGILPENTLRFYIHFTVPMQPQVSFDYIKLSDATGHVDEAAFMRFKQELWNADRTRLTVLMDPGRIKREVATNIDLGPALLAGQTYTLAVKGGWPSADGSSVLPAFARTFRVSEALRERPATRYWTASAPCAGTREPLTIAFDRPFDRHLLTRKLRVTSGPLESIGGAIEVGPAERTWRFTPNRPWPSSGVRVVANPALEDVAGNNFHELLDHVAGTVESVPASTDLPVALRRCAN